MTPVEFQVWLNLPAIQRRPLLMGICNITPDSFSDGGQHLDADRALAHIQKLQTDGADLIDLGAESTRPGSQRVDAAVQIARLANVLPHLDRHFAFSIDTTRAAVAEAALDHGVCLINDISAGTDDPEMFPLAAARRAPIVLMHMQGQPATMQLAPKYDDVVAEVKHYLLSRVAAAQSTGIPSERILLDPGIGFGKTIEHNLALLRDLRTLTALPHPVLVGVSRKRFLTTLTGEPPPPRFTTAAATAWCLSQGAAIARVHDVAEMSRVLKFVATLHSNHQKNP